MDIGSVWLWGGVGALLGAIHAASQNRWVPAISTLVGCISIFFGPRDIVAKPNTLERACTQTFRPTFGATRKPWEVPEECRVDPTEFYVWTGLLIVCGVMGYAAGYALARLFRSNDTASPND